jgi:hypothetical protein
MSSKFEEKQIVEKELRKEKELQVGEKGKNEKAEKEHKDQKDNPDAKHAKESKDNKDNPDTKAQKDHKEGHKDTKEGKEKEGKEHKEHLPDKTHKDVGEVQYTQAFAAQPLHAQGYPKPIEKPLSDIKLHKEVKIEIKEKIEVKEFKHEKFEHKDKFEKEKFEFEGWGGGLWPGDPGPVEQRLTALEATMAQLLHFIPKELRPDLSQGALRQEPDAAPGEAAAKPTDPKSPSKKP